MISVGNAHPFLVLTFGLLIGCSAGPTGAQKDVYQVVRGEAFGTTWSVKWQGESSEKATVSTVVEGELDRLDALMSSWRPDSEISKLSGQYGPQVVSVETAEVLQAALDLATETRGAFDPTVGPLMELWGFRSEKRSVLPTDSEIQVVRAKIGYEKVQMGRASDKWRVDAAGTSIDLGAIAKGTAVDWVSKALLKQDRVHHMVEVGGEMRLSGQGPQGGAWRVGIDDPRVGMQERQLGLILGLTNKGVATSGNYRNRYELEGQVVFHTFDPRTGRPAQTDVLSATVVARDCQTADGVATALMVMSYEEGRSWIDKNSSLEAAWLIQVGNQTHLQHTKGFSPLLEHVADTIVRP